MHEDYVLDGYYVYTEGLGVFFKGIVGNYLIRGWWCECHCWLVLVGGMPLWLRRPRAPAARAQHHHQERYDTATHRFTKKCHYSVNHCYTRQW